MLKIINVCATRPNFQKIAPLMRAYKKYPDIHPIIVYTEDADMNMNYTSFKELDIPTPKYNLGIGEGSNAEQTGKTMIEFEKVCLTENPDLVVIMGDANATIACALVACKLGIKVAHIEAGLRSGNKKIPEEINRKLTDSISDYLFVSEYTGITNLELEGIPGYRTYFVGNIMIDTLLYMWPRIKADSTFMKLRVRPNKYIILTLHKSSNIEHKATLKRLLYIIKKIQKKNIIVWPMHPKTKKNIESFGLNPLLHSMNKLIVTEPLGYIEFMNLVRSCLLVITDSGSIQEETTYLKKPCITLREETERPITLMSGFNILAGTDRKRVTEAFDQLTKKKRDGFILNLWDGKAAERIVEIIYERYKNRAL